MRPITHTALGGLACVLLLTGTAGAKPFSGAAGKAFPVLSTTDGAPVELASRPGSEADRLAQQLMAREIGRARADGEKPLVLVAMGRLNDADEVLIVQVQSRGECGSGGCSTVSFKSVGGRWVKIMDTLG
jgi:hypothetical protein